MIKNKLKVSLLQLQSKGSPKENTIIVKKYLNKTKNFKPDLICLPECVNILTNDRSYLFDNVTSQNKCQILEECLSFSKKNKVFISIGSLLLKDDKSKKLYNRSIFINSFGKIIDHYDKIHLFDVNLTKKDTYKESKSFNKGSKLVNVNTPWGKIGLTICYDLRFPNLYKNLVRKGVKIILVPAAFTTKTGKDHWEVLLRSRAIENSVYIFAPAQCGVHHHKRETYGHSMIINPWGKIIKKANFLPTILNTHIDLSLVDRVRSKITAYKYD